MRPLAKMPAFLVPAGFPPPQQPPPFPHQTNPPPPHGQQRPLYFYYPLYDHRRYNHNVLNPNKGSPPSTTRPWLNQPIAGKPTDKKPTTQNANQRSNGEGGTEGSYGKRKTQPSQNLINSEMPQQKMFKSEDIAFRKRGRPRTSNIPFQLQPLLPKPMPLPQLPILESFQSNRQLDTETKAQQSEKMSTARMLQEKKINVDYPAHRRRGRPRLCLRPVEALKQHRTQPLVRRPPVPHQSAKQVPQLLPRPPTPQKSPKQEGPQPLQRPLSPPKPPKQHELKPLPQRPLSSPRSPKRQELTPLLQQLPPPSLSPKQQGPQRLQPPPPPQSPKHQGSQPLQHPPPPPQSPKQQGTELIEQRPSSTPQSQKQKMLDGEGSNYPDRQSTLSIKSPLFTWISAFSEQQKEVVNTYSNEYLQETAPTQIMLESCEAPLENGSCLSEQKNPNVTNLSKLISPPKTCNVDQSHPKEHHMKAVKSSASLLVSKLKEASDSNQMVDLANETFSYLDSVGVYYLPLYKAVHAFIYHECNLEVAEKLKDGPAFRARTQHHERVTRLMVAKEEQAKANENANKAEQDLYLLRTRVEALKESLRKAEDELAEGEAKLAASKVVEVCCDKAYSKARAEVIEMSDEMDKDYKVIDEVENLLIVSKAGKERMMDELSLLLNYK